MPKPSTAQVKIIAKIEAGGRLALDPANGRYTITEPNGTVRQIDQRPVLAMIHNGLLHQDMGGQCRPAQP